MKLEPQSVLCAQDIGCLLVSSAVDPSTVMTELREASELSFPREAGRVVDTHAFRVLWLTPRSWLIHCPLDSQDVLVGRINEKFPDKSVHAVPYTDQLAWFELRGPDADSRLSQGGFISLEPAGLPVAFAKRTLIAGVAAIIFHERQDAWLIGVERSRAAYMVDWLRATAVSC
jgi:heterotetrameric sarcosine oxidase gamma subunit